MTDDDRLHPNLADALDESATASPDAIALGAVARRLADGPLEDLAAPPSDLFARIEAELASDRVAPAPPVLAERRSRRSRRWLVAAGAAAAIVLVIGGVVVATGDGDAEPQRQEVALASLPGFEGAEGSATLVRNGDERSVTVALSEVDVPAGSHLELWLLDPAVEQLVALGVISGDGAHELPSDVDLAATPIVDVSLEPDDGDPAHSGVSVVRGEIAPT